MSYSSLDPEDEGKSSRDISKMGEGNSKFQQFNLIAYACKSAAAAKGKQH